jgi:hypothetical protein
LTNIWRWSAAGRGSCSAWTSRPPNEHGDQQAGDEYVVDIHRGYSTGGDGKIDTTWALVWHFDAAGKVDRVVNLSGDQHQVDAFIWVNFALKPLPERLIG